jgi:hypothetical protein
VKFLLPARAPARRMLAREYEVELMAKTDRSAAFRARCFEEDLSQSSFFFLNTEKK